MEKKATTRIYLFALLLVVLTGVVYRGSLRAPFIFDDNKWILTRPTVRHLDQAWRTVSTGSRSLLTMSLAVNFAIHEEDPWGYHVFNVAIHALAGLALFGLARRTLVMSGVDQTLGANLAFGISAIWLVHPLQTESVTYVVQRCESMMGLFFLLFLYCFARAIDSARPWLWRVAMFASLALGMASKEVMAMAPFVLLLYDRGFAAGSWRQLLRDRWWLYLGVLSVFVWKAAPYLAPLADGKARGVTMGFGIKYVTPWEYAATQPEIILHYLKLCFWPRQLCLDYMWPVETDLARILMSGAAVAALVAASAACVWKWPKIGFVAMSFFLVLAPTSSVIPIKDLAFEHRLYLPLACVIALPAWLLFHLRHKLLGDARSRAVAGWGALGLIVLVLSLRTMDRNRQYVAGVDIWKTTLEVAPHNHRANFNLGLFYTRRGEYATGAAYYERAIELQSEYDLPHINLAAIAVIQDQFDDALAHLDRAIEIDPNESRAYLVMGNLRTKTDEHWLAVEAYEKAVELDPTHARSRVRCGDAYARVGESAQAIREFEAALQLGGDAVLAKAGLAWTLSTAAEDNLRDGDRALALAKSLTATSAADAYQTFDILAAAHAEVGEFDSAIRYAKQAMRRVVHANDRSKHEDEAAIRDRLALYQGRRPYRFKPAAE
ncbi:MAG: tetratricopeptide repeat protein [Pirellulaceae bacterium]|jgi:tetratricopeptide (TPR) repeat protein|nr:tetratricopeptide repeat protein [Pirellulaceae bacterium]